MRKNVEEMLADKERVEEFKKWKAEQGIEDGEPIQNEEEKHSFE